MRKALACLLVVALVARVTSAQTWHEYNDGGGEAGGLIATAQWTVGGSPLTTILGGDPGQDADLFAIYIPNPALFSAMLTATWFQPALAVRAERQRPSLHCRSAQADVDRAVRARPRHVLHGRVPRPLHRRGPRGAIWNTSGPFSVERAPDGPGAPGPLVGWSGHTTFPFEQYTISFQGAEYAPAPASLVLLSLGAAVLLRRRGDGDAR